MACANIDEATNLLTLKDPDRLCEECELTKDEYECFLYPKNGCAVNSSTEWYHISALEHVCGICFDSIKNSSKYKMFKNNWCKVSKTKPSVGLYIQAEVAPIWIQCTLCNKWRRLFYERYHLFPADIGKFTCKTIYKNSSNPCKEFENFSTSVLEIDNWLEHMRIKPLLHDIPGVNLLDREKLEAMGIFPFSECNYVVPPVSNPFCKKFGSNSAVYVCPDTIDPEEEKYVRKIVQDIPTFMGLRNLIILTYYYSPNEVFSVKKVMKYLFCRGLSRIYLCSLIEDLIRFLTARAVINYGCEVLPPLKNWDLRPQVIIVGCGISGLLAARHLHKLGISYIVLEAADRAGGRIDDYGSMYKGADALNSFKDKCNPLFMIIYQLSKEIKFSYIPSDPVILNADTKLLVSQDSIKRIGIQLKAILNSCATLARRGRIKTETVGGTVRRTLHPREDSPLMETVKNCQKSQREKTGVKFTEEDDLLFDFCLKMLEIYSRTEIESHTLKHYVPPEVFVEDLYCIGGLENCLVDKLKEGLNIRYNTRVTEIFYSNDQVDLFIEDSEEVYTAEKVLLTVPIPILRNKIFFNPPLPDFKKQALEKLGDVLFEKLILCFETKFWSSLLQQRDNEHHRFASISKDYDEQNAPFQFFVDVTETNPEKIPTLVTFITELNCEPVHGKTVRQVIDMCLDHLQKLFPEEKIALTDFCMTCWSQDLNSETSGTFLKLGASESAYDDVATPVEEKLFFAGEGTIRQFPNCVLGAAVSGLREAVRIYETFKSD